MICDVVQSTRTGPFRLFIWTGVGRRRTTSGIRQTAGHLLRVPYTRQSGLPAFKHLDHMFLIAAAMQH